MGELISLSSKERVSSAPLTTSPEVIIDALLSLSEADQRKVQTALAKELSLRDAERMKVIAAERKRREQEAERLAHAREREMAEQVLAGSHVIVQIGSLKTTFQKRRLILTILIMLGFAAAASLRLLAPTDAEIIERMQDRCDRFGPNNECG